MNHPSSQPDIELDQALSSWRSDEPPSDFARNIVEAAAREQARGGTQRTGRGVVIPLLLAAIFLSVGAAAAWGVRQKTETSTAEQAEPIAPLTKGEQLSFALHARSANAEREQAKENDQKRPPPPKAENAPQPPKSDEIDNLGDESAPPRVLHLPKCECGTSGVVCSCAD
jgi:hypothetical protein